MTGIISKKLTLATISVLIVALMIFALLGVSAYARAAEQYEGEMILEAVVSGSATESAPGVYRSIAKDDTFTVTYKLVKNDGMVDAVFTPSYDKDAFELTSFAVDEDKWSLFDDYGGMTAEEYIADRNAKYAAHEIDDFRLTFILSYADVRDPDGALSDEFITIVYTARAALVAPATETAYAFGFDTTTLGGFFTNAAKTGDKLLELKLKVGEEQGEPVTEALGADTFSFDMRAALDLSVDEDQTVSFQYDQLSGTYYIDPTEILYTIADNQGEAFFSDPDATVEYTFYKRNTETGDLEPIVNEQTGEPALPSEPDLVNTYVTVTARGNEHFDVAVSEPVQVAIAPVYMDVPNLRIYDTEHGDEYATLDSDLTAAVSATYGTKFTLKEVVNEEEVAFDAPANATQSATGLNFTYLSSADGNAPYAPEGRPLGIGVATGVHTVKISTPDPTYVKFAGTDLSEIVIDLTVTKATIYLDTVLDEEYLQITYGDPVPPADAFSIEVRGILETGAAHDLILGVVEESATVTSDDPYHNKTQFAPTSSVGTYTYYATSDVDLRNYEVVRGTDAVLTVEQLTLTLTAQYDGNVVTFSASGLLTDDSLNYVYFVKRLPSTTYVMQTSNTYTAQYADAGATLVACVRATPVTGYPGFNYAQGELTLEPVYNVFFQKGNGFAAATGDFATQQCFKDCLATKPADPTFPDYEFAGWTVGGEPFDFENTPIEGNTTIVASWVRASAEFKFRAINTSADLLTGTGYALEWDDQNQKFVIATTEDQGSGNLVPALTADSATFLVEDPIPTKVEIKGFYVKRWWRVIPQQVGDPLVTEVTHFDVYAALDVAENAYYLAEMVLNIGRGDVNGDGVVSVLDLLSMKRYLVGTTIGELRTEQDAWDAALRDDSNGDWFYPDKWDVNGDGYNDTRDIVALREALATGYGYVIMTDWTAGEEYCEGQQVAKAVVVKTAAEMTEAIEASSPVILGSDISFESLDQTALDVNVYIDLGGYTITADEWQLETPSALIVFGGRMMVKEIAFVAARGRVGVLDYGGENFADDDGTFAWSVEP